MAAGTFRVGHRFVQNDHLHRVARNLGGGVLAIENLSTGRVKEQSVAELLDAWRSGALVLGDRPPPAPEAAVYEAIRQANSDAFVQSYSEVQQDRAKAKLPTGSAVIRTPTGTFALWWIVTATRVTRKSATTQSW